MSPGTEFRLAPRLMTRERMRWYVDIQETVQQDTGRIVTQPPKYPAPTFRERNAREKVAKQNQNLRASV